MLWVAWSLPQKAFQGGQTYDYSMTRYRQKCNSLCLICDVLKILYPEEKPITEICTNNTRPFSQPWNVGLLKFNSRKLASKGECLLIAQFLCNVVSPYLKPRLQSLATTSCSCRPLLLFPKASCCEALILQSLWALQDCKQMSRDWLWENQQVLVNWSWIIKIGLHLNTETLEGLYFFSRMEFLKFACMWAPSLPPSSIRKPDSLVEVQSYGTFWLQLIHIR